ncbi:MAG: hypothetical protein A2Y17_07430 [Clostridiales bacterium GWF2_38_85]|nr:MAG: hypothetical protein A2Y17_07430 [Clostridiales bacterium GWF2_38_85]HBL84296.1 AraC family transcriptional regulator [Clostridiales bacterium]
MDNSFKLSYTIDSEQALSLRVYNIGHERCKSSQKWGPGVRDFYLIHHVLSGKGYYVTNGIQYEVIAGSTFIIYPNCTISYFADKEDPWEYYWVGFKGSDASMLLDLTSFTTDNPVQNFNLGNKLKEYLSMIYKSKGKDESCQLRMSGYLLLALSLFIEKNKHYENNISTLYCKKAIEYITYNYSQSISIESISSYIGISRSHLYRSFMECLNKSPLQFIIEYRMERAIHLLKNTSLTIGMIANSVGIIDSLYFSRMFKQHIGMSPSEYRKKSE